MNLAEMISAVKSRSPVKDDTLITEWINEMYLSLAEVAQIPSDSTVTISPEFPLYYLPDNFIELRAVYLVGTTKPLTKIEEEDKSGKSGTPLYYYKRGNLLGFDPAPEQEYEAEVHVYEYPDELTNPTSVPNDKIPKRFRRAIVNGALARAWESDSETRNELQTAKYYMDQFLQAKEELRQQIALENLVPQQITDVYGGW